MTDVGDVPRSTRVVRKYPLEDQEVQTIVVPKRAEPRMVAFDGDKVTLWLEVNPEAETEERTVVVIGDNRHFQLGLRHLGSTETRTIVSNEMTVVSEGVHVYWSQTFGETLGRGVFGL